ncbi:hypothetical protein H5410_047615 [Solanum commersonii]|uniref:Uncharacterized protein n=1 Tax=Solanum commersonii TaxID=4109 RepID=A0A9J5XHI0_SOLCO|nr:hypothetical protein H5410_047615 [Solanum commersonii]
MEANKHVSVFLMCMIVLSVVHVSEAATFDSCNENCQRDCTSNGHGSTYCALRCETDCGYQVLKGEFESLTS